MKQYVTMTTTVRIGQNVFEVLTYRRVSKLIISIDLVFMTIPNKGCHELLISYRSYYV